jgi:hypothetical protein
MELHTRTILSKGAFPGVGKQEETCIETGSGRECTRRKDEGVEVSRCPSMRCLCLERKTRRHFALRLEGCQGRCEKLNLEDEWTWCGR